MLANIITKVKRRSRHVKNIMLGRYFVWKSDRKIIHNPNLLDSSHRQLYEDLCENGFVKIDLFENSIDDLANKAKSIFDKSMAKGDHIVGQNIRYPFLFSPDSGQILKNQTLTQLVKAYLGEGAALNLCQIVRLPETADQNMLSALWHHDSVGYRLKLFLLLSDVAKDGRATYYAKGSHKQKYLGSGYHMSRTDEKTVSEQYEIVRFFGKKGQAYLFDTNGLHRGPWQKVLGYRDTIQFAFSDYQKSQTLFNLDFPIGVRKELFPPDFKWEGTSLAPQEVSKEKDYLVYGKVPIDLNYVHDPLK